MLTWVNKILQSVGWKDFRSLQKVIISRNSFALSLQFIGLALNFGSNILLARLYGDYAYGIFSLVSGWAVLFSVLGIFGMDDRHLAQVPVLNIKGDKNALTDELFGSLKINMITIALSVILFYILISYSNIPVFNRNFHFFLYALMLIPCYAIMNNLLYFLRAMKSIINGEFADKVVRPLAFALCAFLLYYLAGPATPRKALLASIGGLFIVIIVLSLIVRALFAAMPGNSIHRRMKFNAGLNFRYTVLNILYLLSIRIDILLLSLFVSASQVGHYTIASRFADIFSYPVAMLNLSFPALLSEKIHHGNMRDASLLSFTIARNAFWLCLLTGIFFMIISPYIFSLYGKEFGEAISILPIFLLSTLINASMGLSDVFFIMTGGEKKVIRCRVFGLITTIAFASFMIPYFKLAGAAYSILAGNIVYYLLLQYHNWKEFHHFVNPFFRPANI